MGETGLVNGYFTVSDGKCCHGCVNKMVSKLLPSLVVWAKLPLFLLLLPQHLTLPTSRLERKLHMHSQAPSLHFPIIMKEGPGHCQLQTK